MNNSAPFMLLRARPAEAIRPRFGAWFQHAHRGDVARIPGITSVTQGLTPAGTWLGIYTFASTDTVQAALSSPEAAYARGTWEQWGMELEELRIEIFAPLFPLAIYQSAC